MKYNSPRSIALFSAIVISLFLAATLIIYSILNERFNLLALILIIGSAFAFVYFLIRYVLEKFIYGRIKLVYKTISNLKTDKKKESPPALDFKRDIIQDVNQEVIEWARDKSKELEELHKLEHYRRDFLGNVSHELKTPIFNIQGYVLTLLDGGLEDKNINHKYLLRTEKSINRMIAIINDLEAISQLESGELKISFEEFDMVAMCKEVMEFLEVIAGKKEIVLYFNQTYNTPIMVYADKEKIRQVITNLIDNSIKYNSKKGRTKVSFFDMDENYLIEVSDNGMGIEKENIPRIYERFYRTNEGRAKASSGKGLGLAIVKHIIEAHNQRINVRSTIGVGTTFAFTLKKAE